MPTPENDRPRFTRGRNLSLSDIERLLAAGRLYADAGGRQPWQLRRNGATKRWKREASRFLIPVKAGLKTCGSIDQNHLTPDGALTTPFYVSDK